METSRWAVIKGGRVVDITLWDRDAQPEWKYPIPHDLLVQDNHGIVMVGDRYDATEERFYQPVLPAACIDEAT